MPIDRSSGSGKERNRRQFQKLGIDPLGALGITGGDGIIITGPDIAVDIGASAGLEFIAGELFVNVDESFGLSLNASGIRIDLAVDKGLEFSGGNLAVKVDATTALVLSAAGIGIALAANPGLEFSGNKLRVDIGQSPSILVLAAAGLNTQFVTVSGAAGSEAVLVAGGSGTGAQELRHPATNGGRFIANQTNAVMRTGTGGANVTITTTAVDANLVGATTLRVYNATTGAAAGAPAIELLAASSLLQGFSGPITVRSRPATGTNPGPDVTVRGGTASGSNQNGGLVTIAGGEPTGAGTSTISLELTDNGSGVVPRINLDLNGIGFFGATPIAQPGTFTITAAPAVATALDCDANGGAYTATPIALLNAATLADLNDLRADVASLAAVVRQLIRFIGDTAGLGLVNETGY